MKYKKFLWFGLFLFFTCKPSENPGNQQKITEIVENGWEKLSLREKIGQTMLITAMPVIKSAIGSDSLALFFEKYPVGGFFIAPWTIYAYIPESEKEQHLRNLIKLYQSNSKYPLFIVEDFEGGVGHSLPDYTKIPTGVVLGAAESQALAYQVGEAIAKEAVSLGFNWVLHPVADINLNPLNPVTNHRCVSINPDMAISLLSAQIKALQKNGVAATIKHFPGDGLSDMDQHLSTTYNTLSINDWKNNHGKVFAQLIDSGVYAVMTGHIGFPEYQKKNNESALFPVLYLRF